HVTAYRVERLPDVPFDIGEMYSGVIPIDMKNKSRSLFFVFQPTVGPPVDEITIWLNGGPGCSSLEGFLQENGLFIWTWGQYSPTINPYSWVNLTNMLWVEQPVGVGFSTGEVQATSEADIAKDFVDFFLNFQKIFGISKYKIYVTGESYAGIYVPYFAEEMMSRNDPEHFNVSGALMYDPCIGSWIYTQEQAIAVPWIQQNNNILGFNDTFLKHLDVQDKRCGYAAYREQYLTFPASGMQAPAYFNFTSQADCDLWTLAHNEAFHTNPCFNVYEPNLQCPLLSDPLGWPTDLQYSYAGLPIYFNRTDVKKAMHAPMDVSWLDCSLSPIFLGDGGPEDEGDLSPDPIQSVLPRLIESTNRVLIANGALDYDIITNGTLISIQNMTWGGTMGFKERPSKPIDIRLPDLQYQSTFEKNGFGGMDNPQGIMGVQHFERGLMFAETLLSGHMEPQFQPRVSYRHLQWVLGRIDEL
ncbi:serine-type carboxypeptidase F, partial [Rhizodiscina lignyota]